MSASPLSSLLLTYDLRVACGHCCVQESQVTYSLKTIQHHCVSNVLLCRAKDDFRWRPVSNRPSFPTPNKYEVCWFFKENLGCTVHKNRCTFARSKEEAAVWTFEKQHGLDHFRLCMMVVQLGRTPNPSKNLEPLDLLFANLELKAVCDLCSDKVNELTYTVQSVVHKCGRSLLLAKGKASDKWRPISERPSGGHVGPNTIYKVCNYTVEGSACTQHTQGQGCTYAKSSEEVTVWNYLRENKIDKTELIRVISESDSTTPERAAESILQNFGGEFIEFCKRCFHDTPIKLTPKRWNETCSADAAHDWDPVLVHHLSENNTKHIYGQVRPLPSNCTFEYCSHVRQGKPCWHKAGHCKSAQSEVEMAVWKAEHSGLHVRPHLLQLSQQRQTQSQRVTIFCKVCFLELSSPESFYKHCSSLEHAQLLSLDTTTRWKQRQPPHTRREEFWLCDR